MTRKTSRFSYLMMLSLCAASMSTFAADDVKWGYKGSIGPEKWGSLSKSFAICLKGKAQSPIDIPRKVTDKENSLAINYQNAPMVIVDDGETDLMIGDTQTIIHDGHGIQLNFPVEAKEIITFNGADYHLVQFHIHTPGENKQHGQVFPMEIHFVHQGDGGKLAVIGVLAKISKDNHPVIEKIVNNLPKEEGKPQTIDGQQVNPMDLLPAKRDFYSFVGSLTTPPCAEGLQWIVMAEPINISSEQLAKLKKAVDGANARPAQRLNGREISFTQAK
jgi:carbonic anhydrase